MMFQMYFRNQVISNCKPRGTVYIYPEPAISHSEVQQIRQRRLITRRDKNDSWLFHNGNLDFGHGWL